MIENVTYSAFSYQQSAVSQTECSMLITECRPLIAL